MLQNKKREILQIFNIVAYILTIVFNALSGTGIFNGKTIGGVSDDYPNLFTPAGITFSIWSVIYLFLFIFVIYQARDVFKTEKEDMPFIEQTSIFFILSCVFNSVWLIVWLYGFILLSLVVMLCLLGSLIIIYLRLNIALGDLTGKEKIIVWVPFSLYLGWINIATIANTAAFLVSINWDGFGISPFTWTITIIIVAVILTLTILYTRKDLVLPLVTIWALIGIAIRRYDQIVDLAITALIMMLIVIAGMVIFIIKSRIQK
ncbi:MAG: hypothetical protein EU539_11675 [Promethearchaeota archaeon]|nr:MAG: hypothetical protein EU539_11675 [Candidatus Lokiarchaeota archaeon]